MVGDSVATAAHDGAQVDHRTKGNFEWWYFDLIQPGPGYLPRLIAHLGTGPLRTRITPKLVLSVHTPELNRVFDTRFPAGSRRASADTCDVRVGEAFHAW